MNTQSRNLFEEPEQGDDLGYAVSAQFANTLPRRRLTTLEEQLVAQLEQLGLRFRGNLRQFTMWSPTRMLSDDEIAGVFAWLIMDAGATHVEMSDLEDLALQGRTSSSQFCFDSNAPGPARDGLLRLYAERKLKAGLLMRAFATVKRRRDLH